MLDKGVFPFVIMMFEVSRAHTMCSKPLDQCTALFPLCLGLFMMQIHGDMNVEVFRHSFQSRYLADWDFNQNPFLEGL